MGFQILDSTGKLKTSVVAVNAASITSGILPDARMPNLTGDVTTVEGAVATTLANIPAISGANLTNLNATNLASGTVTDARLSANVVLENAANSMTLTNPMTTIAESWIGPSSTAGVYFKGGYIGIGTITPDAMLNIFDAGTNGMHFDAASIALMRFRRAGANKWGFINNDAGTDYFGFYNYTVGVYQLVFRPDGSSHFAGTLNISGKTTLGAPANLKNYTVATLPAGVRGDVAYVTDALAPTFLVTIAGGGAIVTPVFYNGANWVAG